MKGKFLLFLMTFGLLSSNMASAAILCSGTVVNSYISRSGVLTIRGDWRGDYTAICNVKGDSVVDSVTCSHWASMIHAAMTNNMEIWIRYELGDSSVTCSNLKTYGGAPTPSYVMLPKT